MYVSRTVFFYAYSLQSLLKINCYGSFDRYCLVFRRNLWCFTPFTVLLFDNSVFAQSALDVYVIQSLQYIVQLDQICICKFGIFGVVLYDLSNVSEYQNYEYLSVVLQKTSIPHWDEIFSEGHSYILEASFHDMFCESFTPGQLKLDRFIAEESARNLSNS